MVNVVQVQKSPGNFFLVLFFLQSLNDFISQDLMAFQLLGLVLTGGFDFYGSDLKFSSVFTSFLDDASTQAHFIQSFSDVRNAARLFELNPDEGSFAKIHTHFQAFSQGNIQDAGQNDEGGQSQSYPFKFKPINVGCFFEDVHVRYSTS